MRYAIGDIHGCYQSLQKLVEDKIKPGIHDRIIFLGDYIDRGPNSKAVVDYIFSLQAQGLNCFFLRGNHEEMLLESANHAAMYRTWIMNGGHTTLKNFGIDHHNRLKQKSIQHIPEKHLSFFRNTQYYIDTEEDYFFVHAALNFKIRNPLDDKRAMVWKREVSYKKKFFGKKKLVYGHTPVPLEYIRHQIESGSDTINLDAGCVYNNIDKLGNLVALNLDNMELLVQPNIEKPY